MMTDHRRATQLFAAELDFDLTSEERLELGRHLEECASCRQIEVDLRTDAAGLRGLPRTDAPGRLRQTVADAAWQEAVPHRSRAGLILLVAAVLMMLALAIGGGLAASQWLQRDEDSTRPTPMRRAWVIGDASEVAMEGFVIAHRVVP